MLYALSINMRLRDVGRRGVHVLKSKVPFTIQKVIIRVKSGKIGHQVNSDTHLRTV